MRTLLRAVLVAGFVVVLTIVGVAVALSTLPYPEATIRIDGETLSLSGLDAWQAAAVVTAAATALVGFVVASGLGILAGVLVVLLAAALAVGVVAVVGLVCTAPLLLLVWLVCRALAAPRSPPPAPLAS